jgi:hypothetical protein
MSDRTVFPVEADPGAEPASAEFSRTNASGSRSSQDWLRDHLDAVAATITMAGLAFRIWVAGRTYLNPDEALHYIIINQPSLWLAYKASLTNAHPPLIYFVVYAWHYLGRSELMLRMPSVLAGTAFCWLTYKWIRIAASEAVSLIAVIFLAFSPATVSLSAELRAYGLMLGCMGGALYFLAQAFEKQSVRQMWLFSVCLYLAILCHYSVIFFVVAASVYALARIADSQLPRKVAVAWAAGQAGVLALYGFLYVSHVSKIKSSVAAWAIPFTTAYFHPTDGNVLAFTKANTVNIFLFLFARRFVAFALLLSFVAGVAFVLGEDILQKRRNSRSNHLGLLLLLPFVAVWGASLVGIYPYVGSRHTVFLAPFAIAGASYLLAAISGQRLWAGAAIAAVLMAFSLTADQSMESNLSKESDSPQVMAAAVKFMKDTIPQGDHILVDFQSSLPITYYFCGPKQIVPFEAFSGDYFDFACGGNPIVSLHTWKAGAVSFPLQFQKMAAAHGLKPGDRVWFYQTGWGETLDTRLDRRDPMFQCLNPRSFGRGVIVIPFAVGPDYFPTTALQSCSH